MRILQTPVRVYATGGVEQYVLCLSRALAVRGHQVQILAADEPGPLSVPDTVAVIPLPYIGKLANTNITPTLPLHLLKRKADIIHTHLPAPWSSDWSGIIARVKKIPLVLNYYNDIAGIGLYSPIARAYNRSFLTLLLSKAEVILVNRPHFLSQHLVHYKDKIRFIPPGVDTGHFFPRQSPRKWDLFFLSVLDRYHHYKGLDSLLSALVIVKKHRPDVRLLLGGAGELLEYYRSRIHSLGLRDNVEFAGYIPYFSLPDYYSRSRIFVLPSSDPNLEGFGMVTLEAMACATPVITTPVSGVADEIRAAGAGIIQDPGSPERLAEAIADLLDDEDRISRMGRAGRELVERRYSWERIAGEVEGVYREVMGF
ncbi:MAG: glycosyltransferase family 4 protein [Methanolinea sp.]|nr:glycosyltransferase family 4 protein [Methanolinea sp.]